MDVARGKGFTLIELMVVLALLAIVAFVAIPNFTNLIRSNQLQASAEEFNSILQYARSEATIRRVPVTVDLDLADKEIEVSARGQVLRAARIQTASVSVASTDTQLVFRPNGTSNTPGFSAIFCGDDAPADGFLLTVSGSGATTLHHKGKSATGNSLGSCTP